MLAWLRKRHVTKRILWGIAAMIVPAFVLWGVGSAIRSGRMSQAIATLDGAKINIHDYMKSLRAVEHFARLVYGNQVRAQMNEEQMRGEAWDRTLLLTEARRRKLKATDDEVVTYVRSLPFLQQQGGFDLRTYDYIIRYGVGSTPREFESEVRQQIEILKLRQAIGNEVAVADDEIRAQFVARRQPFRIAYTLVPFAAISELPEPTSEELQQHYQAHGDQLRVPDRAVIRYTVMPKPAAPANPPTPASDESPSTNDPQLATDAAAATAPATDATTRHETRDTSPENPSPTVADAPQTTATDAVEDAAERAKAEAAEQKRRAERLVDRILADPTRFAAVAQQEGLTAQDTPPFAAEEPVPGLGYEPVVAMEAFRLTVGDISDPIETANGFVILQVAQRQPAHLLPFDEAADRVRAAWLAEQRRRLTKERADTLLAQLTEAAARQPGTSLDALPMPLNLPITKADPIDPSGYINGVGPAALVAPFVETLMAGAIAATAIETPSGYAIVQLIERLPFDESQWEAERNALRQQLLSERQAKHYEAWLDGLRQRVVILTRPEEALEEAAEDE